MTPTRRCQLPGVTHGSAVKGREAKCGATGGTGNPHWPLKPARRSKAQSPWRSTHAGLRGRSISGAPVQRMTRHPRGASVAKDGQVAAALAADVEEVVSARDEPSGEAETVGAGDVEKVVLRHRKPPQQDMEWGSNVDYTPGHPRSARGPGDGGTPRWGGMRRGSDTDGDPGWATGGRRDTPTQEGAPLLTARGVGPCGTRGTTQRTRTTGRQATGESVARRLRGTHTQGVRWSRSTDNAPQSSQRVQRKVLERETKHMARPKHQAQTTSCRRGCLDTRQPPPLGSPAGDYTLAPRSRQPVTQPA